MATKRIIADADFGRIVVRTHRRVRNITMRPKADGLYVTVPPFTKTSLVAETVEAYRVRLLEGFRRSEPRRLDLDYAIDAECFKLTVARGVTRRFMITCPEGRYVISCPPEADFSLPEVQALLRNAVVRALKHSASRFLPPLLSDWSERCNLPYGKVRITGARGKWGSCSSAKTISLSCYLMLLPPHLMDYVILHELAHTREMNHGEAFYALLDNLTGGLSKQLRAELRMFRPDF